MSDVKNKLKVNVVILCTDNPDSNKTLHKEIYNWRGENVVLNRTLSYTDNPTYIRNIKLTTDRKANTNSQSKHEFYNLYFTVEYDKNNPLTHIKEHDYFISDDRDNIYQLPKMSLNICVRHDTPDSWIISKQKDGERLNPNWCYRIIATTDKSLNLPLIPNSFIQKYVEKNGDIKQVMVELGLESEPWIEHTKDITQGGFRDKIKTRKDNTVICSPIITFTNEQLEIIKEFGRECFETGSMYKSDLSNSYKEFWNEKLNDL